MWWTGLRIFPLPIYWCSSTSYYSVIWIIAFLCTVLLGASFFTCTVISRCTVRCTVLYRCIDRIPSHQESLLIAVCCVYSVWLCWCCVVHKLSRSLRTRPVRERTFRLHKFRYWWKTVNSLFPSFYQIICLFAGSMNSIFAVHSIFHHVLSRAHLRWLFCCQQGFHSKSSRQHSSRKRPWRVDIWINKLP